MKTVTTKNLKRTLTPLLALLVISGCAAVPGSDEEATISNAERALASSPPTYTVGDEYRFNNPDVVWRVVAVRGDQIDWVSDTGDRQTTSANPLMPALVWDSETRGSGRRLLSDGTGALFPLKVGNEMTFKSTVSTDKPPYAWEFDWECAVVGEATVTSPAGEYNTFEVECGRGTNPKELTFYYAPTVGHYVTMEIAGASEGEMIARQLVAFKRTIPGVEGAAEQMVASTPVVSSTGVSERTGYKTPEMIASEGQGEVPQQLTNAQAISSQAVAAAQPKASPVIVNPGERAAPPPLIMDGPTDTPVPSTGSASGQRAVLPSSVAQAVSTLEPAPSTLPMLVPEGSKAGPVQGVAVHLASYKSEAGAVNGWSVLEKANPGLLSGMRAEIRRVNLGSKGVFYRLYGTGISDSTTAGNLCAQFQRRGQYCKAISLS